MNATIAEIVEGARNATILGEGPNGEKYVNFEDYVYLTSEQKLNNPEGRVNTPEVNPDGSWAGTSPKFIAVSLDTLFTNRAKVTEEYVYVVTDWWSIQEQKFGRAPYKRVTCHVFKRTGKKLTFEKTTTIPDTEFISDYTTELGHKTMRVILPQIEERGTEKTELI